MNTTISDKEKESKHWMYVALIMGYNQLAHKATKLGDKIWFRLMTNEIEKQAKDFDVKIERTNPENPMLVLSYREPEIEFFERDIEMMRACVAEYDSKKKKTADDLITAVKQARGGP